MSEKTKPKTAKKKKAPAQQSVLGNLSATRPSRLARRHDEPAKVEATAKAEATAEAPAPAAPAATEPRAIEPAKKAGTRTTQPAAPRRTPKAKPATAAKSAGRGSAAKSAGEATAAKRPRTAAKPQPVAAAEAPKTFEPTVAADQAAAPVPDAPAPKTFDRTAASSRASRRGPRAVRAGAPSLEQPERREPAPPPSNGGVPRGADLVTTAIQAAGELTKIGITVGSQILKRTLERLPRR
jgi:hypothetical protein